jgi:hypothetical protein
MSPGIAAKQKEPVGASIDDSRGVLSTGVLRVVGRAELVVPGQVKAVEHITIAQHSELDRHELEVIQASISGYERVGDDGNGEADPVGVRKQTGQVHRRIDLPGIVRERTPV